jgi:hypothetical protein
LREVDIVEGVDSLGGMRRGRGREEGGGRREGGRGRRRYGSRGIKRDEGEERWRQEARETKVTDVIPRQDCRIFKVRL